MQACVLGPVALARFAELEGGMVAVVELALDRGLWRLRDIRRIPSAEYHAFGGVAM